MRRRNPRHDTGIYYAQALNTVRLEIGIHDTASSRRIIGQVPTGLLFAGEPCTRINAVSSSSLSSPLESGASKASTVSLPNTALADSVRISCRTLRILAINTATSHGTTDPPKSMAGGARGGNCAVVAATRPRVSGFCMYTETPGVVLNANSETEALVERIGEGEQRVAHSSQHERPRAYRPGDR